ncbi:MAG: LLM class F420-dependent oxidoreductase [bacterium]
MKYGILMFQADFAIRPDELAKAVEERGFESLFFPEHTHIPSSRETPWSDRGHDLPEMYSHTYDLFVALTAAAMATTTLTLASGICLIIQRDPIITAKAVASLDRLCGGRLIFGVGGGWNQEEMENHGTAYKTRWGLMRERVEAMKAIWSEEAASYHGKHVHFDNIWSWPKPLQQPHPPILVAGNGARTLQRVARYGDGWLPLASGIDSFRDSIKELRDLCAAANKPPATVNLFYAPTSKPEKLEQFREEGVSRFIWGVPSEGRDVVLAKLDGLVKLREQLEG